MHKPFLHRPGLRAIAELCEDDDGPLRRCRDAAASRVDPVPIRGEVPNNFSPAVDPDLFFRKIGNFMLRVKLQRMCRIYYVPIFTIIHGDDDDARAIFYAI